MATFTAGTSFTDGVTGDVTAAKLNALVANATPLSNFITDRTAETSIATDDLVLISDTSDSGALNKMTVANFTNIVSTGTGTAADPAIRPTGDTNTGIFFPAADTIAFSEGGTEAMRIDSSGNVGIGTTSPSSILHISKTGAAFPSSSNPRIRLDEVSSGRFGIIEFDSSTNLNIWGSDAGSGSIRFFNGAGSGTERLRIDSSGNVGIGTSSPASTLHVSASQSAIRLTDTNGTPNTFRILAKDSTTNAFRIYDDTANAERLRITSDGEVLVGKTSSDSTTAGVRLVSDGAIIGVRSGNDCALFNRLSSDGTIISLQQDSVQEGTISVSGTTVSYNGGHLSRWSQLPTGDRDLSIKKGTVLSNLDEMCVWNDAEGNPLPNEQLNMVKISDVEGDSNVAGVFVNWDNDDQDNPFDLNMAMTGDMIIRIAQGVTVSRGDLLMSAGDGTAKPQGDDTRKAKTIAKVTSTNVTCTYEDGSYCVPCVLMAC